MIWIDWLLCAVIVLSAMISLWRGFVSEALSLLNWVISITVAMLFYDNLGMVLAQWVETPSVAKISAFVLLLLATLMVGAIFSKLMSMLVEATGLTGTDRILGVVFGAVRGGLIVVMIVAVLQELPVAEDDWWQKSQLLPHFELMADWSKHYLGEKLSYLI